MTDFMAEMPKLAGIVIGAGLLTVLTKEMFESEMPHKKSERLLDMVK
jgi:hypothetical protein